MGASRAALAGLAAAALLTVTLPAVVLGTPEPRDRDRDRDRDRPRAERTPRPERSRSPDAGTVEEPVAPQPVALVPDRPALTIGYREPGILGQAPLLVAQEAGYFATAGFDDVRIVEVGDTLADIRSGELDLGVVDAREAAAVAAGDDPTLRAVAGFASYAADGTYGGDLIVAAPGLVADEPATVIAFLTAYIRALQDLSEPDGAADALALISATDLAVDPELVEGWSDAVAVFGPFDGGFGARDVEGGLGELDGWLADGGGDLPVLSYFIASHTLNAAQAGLGLPPNPDTGLTGAPGLTEVRVGLAPSEGGSPALSAALDGGHFEDAGFAQVTIVDVEEPLLGLLNGELELGVVDAETAAEGVAQGLPLVALAGHVNAVGERDVLAASADLVAEEGETVSAFLIAYLRGLADLADDPAAAAFVPLDGGFGDRALDGGLAEIRADLLESLGAEPDLGALIAEAPLELAQAWWGLPANPIRVPTPVVTEEAG